MYSGISVLETQSLKIQIMFQVTVTVY